MESPIKSIIIGSGHKLLTSIPFHLHTLADSTHTGEVRMSRALLADFRGGASQRTDSDLIPVLSTIRA